VKFWDWFARSPLASFLRTFIAIVLAMFLADGADVFAVDSTDVRTWIAAGFAAALPTVIRAINPVDTAFGNGTGVTADVHDVFGTDDKDPSA